MVEIVASGNGLPATDREARLAGKLSPIAGGGLPAAGSEESYTIEVVAQLLKMSARTLRYWIDKDRVSTIESPTGRRISAAELERLRPIATAHIVQHAGRRVQLPAEGCQQPATAYRLPAGDFGPDLNNYRLPAEDCQQPATAYRQPVEDGRQEWEQSLRTERLELKLEGAHMAARLHAQRRREEAERFLAERRELQTRHAGELAREQAQVEREREERAKREEQIGFLQEQLQASRQAEHELRVLMAQQTQALQRTAQSLEALEARSALPPPRKKLKWWPFGQRRR